MKTADRIQNIEKYIYCIVFFVGICILAFFTTKPAIKRIEHLKVFNKVQNTHAENDIGKNVDNSIEKSFYKRQKWFETYASVNHLIGKKEIDGFSYALDKNGALHPLNFWVNVESHNYRRYAQQVLTLKNNVKKSGGKLVLMGIPNKYNESWTNGYQGMPYNDYNKQLDELFLWSRRYGIDYIDFRDTLKNSGMNMNKMFYKTDEYWTGTAAFTSFKELVAHLNLKYNAKLDSNKYYRNFDNYEVKSHKNVLLGSYGRKTGKSMVPSGLDSFETIMPKFAGNITFNGKTGNYKDTVLDEGKLTYDSAYESNLFGYYMSGIKATETIVNNNNPKGPKVLWIRDPAASPLIVDTIPLFSKIDCVWGKYATDSYIKNVLKEKKYDYVFISYETVNLVPEFFQFYKNDHPKKDTVNKAHSKKK